MNARKDPYHWSWRTYKLKTQRAALHTKDDAGIAVTASAAEDTQSTLDSTVWWGWEGPSALESSLPVSSNMAQDHTRSSLRNGSLCPHTNVGKNPQQYHF